MTPDRFTLQELYLDVGNEHQLYIQEWGNKTSARTIIFLHGGPGAGCSDRHKQLFDGDKEHVIFFDQRGAGKSLPKGCLEHNTTAELIEDIKKIAHHFRLKTFILTGGSWGSCLALAYAIKYPKSVSAMVLRGIYTGSRVETDYLDKGGFQLFYPDVWEAYLQRTPKQHHNDPSAFHYAQMMSGDAEKVKASSYAYGELETSLLQLDDRHTPQDFETFDPDAMKIELHYLGNRCFMPDKYILNNAHIISAPVWLVQGRYDMVCPPKTAYELSKRLPNSKLIFTQAGHSGRDRAAYEVTKALLLEIAA